MLGNIIVVMIIVAIATGAIAKIIIDKRNGVQCSGCPSCPSKSACSRQSSS